MKEEINYYQVIEGTSYYTEEYVKYLQSQLKAKEEVIKEVREVISKMISIGYIVENGATAIQYIPTGKKTEFYPRAKIIDEILSKGENK